MDHSAHGTHGEHRDHDGGTRVFGEGAESAEQLWDDRYREQSRIWSGRPNPQLVVETAGPAPVHNATALDLGCGEGADAIWLAQQGWAVTAVDVSAVALERAAAHAATSGVEISFQRQDLATWRPDTGFGLVSSQYLHSPLLDWRASVATAAGAVAPGGTLLVVGHYPQGQHAARETFYTPEELGAALEGVLDTWTVNVLETRERIVTGPDGESKTLVDTVLRATRS